MAVQVMGDPFGVDAGWLNQALHEANPALTANVTDVQLDGFIGTGQMGRSARYQLTWDDPSAQPASMVGKFPADDPTARATGFANNSYMKEWQFYNELRPTVSVRTPIPYANLWDEAGQQFALIMEDLSGSVQGDQFIGLTVDQAALAVEQAVALHAPRWGDDSLLALHATTPEDSAGLLSMMYMMFLEGTLARIGSRLDDEVIALATELGQVVGRWALGTGTPSTLVHMDFRPDNFLFGVATDAPPLVVVDWQTITYGAGTNDLAYMIGGSFEPARRAEVERALVADYSQRLHAVGVAYDDETCWFDYRVNSVWGVVMSVVATMMAAETERGNAMLATMLSRHAHHAIDVEALRLLRELTP